MSKTKIRDFLFGGKDGCSDANCIVRGKTTGMHTNGGCQCFDKLSRFERGILAAKINLIGDIEIDVQ